MDETKLMHWAKSVSDSDHSGHDFAHIQRVVALTKRLLDATSGADATVAIAAAILHDTYDDKLVANMPAAKATTIRAMGSAGLTAEEQDAVIEIIDRMSFKANLGQRQELSLTGQLVQDADRLDAMGAIGIARTMMYGGAHGSVLYDPSQVPRTDLDAGSYRNDPGTIINHFHEKLLGLARTMNTPAAQALAAHRHRVMTAYLAEFVAEWSGEK